MRFPEEGPPRRRQLRRSSDHFLTVCALALILVSGFLLLGGRIDVGDDGVDIQVPDIEVPKVNVTLPK